MNGFWGADFMFGPKCSRFNDCEPVLARPHAIFIVYAVDKQFVPKSADLTKDFQLHKTARGDNGPHFAISTRVRKAFPLLVMPRMIMICSDDRKFLRLGKFSIRRLRAGQQIWKHD